MNVVEILGITSVIAVIIPGIILPLLTRNLKVKVLRNLILLLSVFALIHGLYHIMALFNSFTIGTLANLISVIILIIMGVYYTIKVG